MLVLLILCFYAGYALDSSAGKLNGWEYVETSAHKLHSELIELIKTTLDPALLKPVVKPSRRHEGRECVVILEKRQNIQMKKGDWMCSCPFYGFWYLTFFSAPYPVHKFSRLYQCVKRLFYFIFAYTNTVCLKNMLLLMS
ncbi:hypothetical protein MKX01_008830 [Papaver californicum]|nr:hypothetical protein MKX01_008830 [Papaver californicum]